MEFWGVEVKAGQSLKVRPEYLKLIHISQAALGEVKDGKGPKNVPLRLKVDGKDFVIGSLAAEERSQLAFDLVFEKEFELSHGWKDGSVHFLGYTADDQVSDGEISSDDCPDFSADKDVPVAAPENGHAEPKSVIAEFVKNADAEDDDTDSDSDSDDEENEDDDSEDEDDESSEEEEEEELPQMQALKKRDAESPKDAAPAEKAEQDSEEEDESSEEEEEVPQAPKKRAAKSPKNATPAKKAKPEQKAFPAKTAGKGQQAGNKSKGKTGKAGGRK